MGDLDAPSVPDGPEGRLLVIPPDPADLDGIPPTECAGSAHRDTAVDQNEFELPGDALPDQVLEHQLAGPVLVGGGGYDQCAYREAGDVDCDDALRAFGAAVGAAAVVEGDPAVRGAACQWVSMTTIEGVSSDRPCTSRLRA